MSIPDQVPTPLAAIDELHTRLNAHFSTHITHSLDYRIYNLKQLAYLLKDNEARIHAAIKRDLDIGDFAVSFSELWPIYNEIDLAVRRLKGWMKDEGRVWDAILSFKLMRPMVRKQPKGVALIISPWNYPWQCALIPLVGAIAAGCPATIKPSELAPSSSALLAELLPRYLDPEGYAVVLGDKDQASRLLEKQWGHIIFTGSGTVGKIVAKAAAETLTPSTLELGGKCPVVVSACANVTLTARRMMGIKQLTIGQMCVCPDYVLVDQSRFEEFWGACVETLDNFFPKSPHPQSITQTPMSACLRSASSLERQTTFLEDAERKGKRVYRGEVDKGSRRMGISLVKMELDGLGEAGSLIEEEVFGPVMAIIPVSDLDAAIRYINARPRPLALYVCSRQRAVFKKVIKETTSGSATWNDFGFATIARSLPFGGVGDSGWGSYHGYDGFRTFTHFKATLEVPLLFEPLMALRYPPLSSFGKKVLTLLLYSGGNFARPVSVEGEARKRRKERIRRALVGVLILLVGAWGGLAASGRAKGWKYGSK